MSHRMAIVACALVAGLAATDAGAHDLSKNDLSKYPDWSGQWRRVGGIQWDPTKPLGAGQHAPLTPEYQAIFDASLADQSHGGQGNNARFTCIPARHAAGDDRHVSVRNHCHAEDHLYPV
jgi:hypothetical protein